ncbi:hypothetical protein NE452_18095, partial [Paeniclostridium sordellii]|nr:hypothetical protein [Paeniclostridium sordellii]
IEITGYIEEEKLNIAKKYLLPKQIKEHALKEGFVWKQKEEFESFNGPILMTTNCIVPPKDSYKDRLYTTGAAGFTGCTHIKGNSEADKDFSVIIEHAKK